MINSILPANLCFVVTVPLFFTELQPLLLVAPMNELKKHREPHVGVLSQRFEKIIDSDLKKHFEF